MTRRLSAFCLLLVLNSGLCGSEPLIAPPITAQELKHQIRSDEVNSTGYTGRGVTVAFVDTGYDYPDVPLLAWYDQAGLFPQPVDLAKGRDGKYKHFGHGTMVAGCVRFTAPEADLVGVRYDRSPAGLAKAVDWIIEHQHEYHIRVVNLSIAGGDSPAVRLAVRRAIEHGMVVIASMGNNGPKPDGGACPGCIPEVVTVGGAADEKTVWENSSRGPMSDGVCKPDLCAPAEFIATWMQPGSHFDTYTSNIEAVRKQDDDKLLVTYTQEPGRFGSWKALPSDILRRLDAASLIRSSLPRWYRIDDYHLVGDGTSLSAPLVAGVVATMLQAAPEAKPAQIRDALVGSARPMDPKFGPNDRGSGFIDAMGAVQRLLRNSSQPAETFDR